MVALDVDPAVVPGSVVSGNGVPGKVVKPMPVSKLNENNLWAIISIIWQQTTYNVTTERHMRLYHLYMTSYGSKIAFRHCLPN